MSAHTTETQLKLIGKLLLEEELHCETDAMWERARARSKSEAPTTP